MSARMCTSRAFAHAGPLLRGFRSTAASDALVEMRDYTIKPEMFSRYIEIAGVAAEVRTKYMPFLGMFTPETGSVLNRVVHFYAYESLQEREERRKAMMGRQQWTAFLSQSRPCVLGPQTSVVMSEVSALHHALNISPTASFKPPDDSIKGMYELREYQLVPGTLQRFTSELAEGLPLKVSTYPECKPAFFGSMKLGQCSTFVEMWRYQSTQAWLEAQKALDASDSWQNTVQKISPCIQSYSTELYRPVWFSPWQ